MPQMRLGGLGTDPLLAMAVLMGLHGNSSPDLFSRRLRLMLTDRDFTGEDYDTLLALDGDGSTPATRHPTATQSDLDRLPVSTLVKEDLQRAAERGEDMACPICLEQWGPGDAVRTLPCLHRIHKGCVDTWLKQNAVCPICKFSAV